LGCHSAHLIRCLGCLKLFSNFSFECLWSPLAVQPPCLTITRTIWSEWTLAWWPPSSYPCPLPMRSSLPAWLSWELSDLSKLYCDSSPKPLCKFPISSPKLSFEERSRLVLYCKLLTFCSFDFNILRHCFVNSIILRLLSSLYFWSYKCIPGILILHLSTT
jgi:hypothetical protein